MTIENINAIVTNFDKALCMVIVMVSIYTKLQVLKAYNSGYVNVSVL